MDEDVDSVNIFSGDEATNLAAKRTKFDKIKPNEISENSNTIQQTSKDADVEKSVSNNNQDSCSAETTFAKNNNDIEPQSEPEPKMETEIHLSDDSNKVEVEAKEMEAKGETAASSSGAIPKTNNSKSNKSPNRKSKYLNRNYRSQVYSFQSSSSSSSSDEEDGNRRVGEGRSTKTRERKATPSAESNTNTNPNSEQREQESVRNPLPVSTSDSTSSVDSFNRFILNHLSDYADTDNDEDDDSSCMSASDMADMATEIETKTAFLSRPKPKYTWCAVPELLYRQSGLSGKGRRALGGESPLIFQARMGGSLHAVERLELMYKLQGHGGCVNSLNFNRGGNLLVTGSDDLKIIFWKWSSNEIALSFDSGHSSNVFQTKFIELGGGVHVISSARDGQVRHHAVPSSGGEPVANTLIKHLGPVHKLALPVTNPFEVLTAGEDGHVVRCDLRDNKTEKLVTIKVKNRKVPLYSISAHPLQQEFCVTGRDQYVRVYDQRNVKSTVKVMCPDHLMSKKPFTTYITCAVYNYLGTEILASYSDEDIYLFDNKNISPGPYLHKYQGHDNSSTIKGVNFFGTRSEFVMSGSDCGSCFFWDKNTETIVQWMAGDEAGVVNCLEPHPSFPVLATSGLDHDVKIWVPSNEKEPTFEGLKKCVHRNMSRRNNVGAGEDIFDDQMITFFVRQCLRHRRSRDPFCPNVADLVSSDSDEDDTDGYRSSYNGGDNLHALPCTPS